MTTLTESFTQPDELRVGVADERGDGRPDFNYGARVLYADSLSPASVSAAGGTITISGMGFRTGNAVTVNGVAATVTSWSENSIVATVPSVYALGASTALTADVEVTDLSTGGLTVMSQSLSYSAPVPVLHLLSAPSGVVMVGQPAPTVFAVKLVAGDGVTPMAGAAVTFTATTGDVEFAACGAASCTAFTDGSGVASSVVTAEGAGAITVQASGVGGTVSASFTAEVLVQRATAVQAAEYVAAGATVAWNPQVSLSDNFASTTGVVVSWQSLSGPVLVAPAQSVATAEGVAQTIATVGPLASGGQASLGGCAWTSVCASFTMRGVDPSDLRLVVVSGANQMISAEGSFAPVVLQVTDTLSHPVAGAVVQVYQTVDAWQIACPVRGRCPTPPVLTSSQASATSDTEGLVTVVPQQIPGVAGTTNLAAVAGTQGFASLAVQAQP
jgi:hypothetical protein